jgi:hypothetical protein
MTTTYHTGANKMSPRYTVRLSQAVHALIVALKNGGEFPDQAYIVAKRFAVTQADLEQRYDIEGN